MDPSVSIVKYMFRGKTEQNKSTHLQQLHANRLRFLTNIIVQVSCSYSILKFSRTKNLSILISMGLIMPR